MTNKIKSKKLHLSQTCRKLLKESKRHSQANMMQRRLVLQSMLASIISGKLQVSTPHSTDFNKWLSPWQEGLPPFFFSIVKMDVDQALEPPDQGDTDFEATWVFQLASSTQLAQIPALKTDLEKDCFRYLHVVFAGYLKVRGCVVSFFLIYFFVGSFYVRIAIHKTGLCLARLASKPVAGAATQFFLAPPKIQCETGRKTKTISDDMA